MSKAKKKCDVCKRKMKSTRTRVYTSGFCTLQYNVCLGCVRKENQYSRLATEWEKQMWV